jgi:beta-glucosidase
MHWFVKGDYYSGGGSGHVFAGTNVVTPLDGIQRYASSRGIDVISSTTDDIGKAEAAVSQADLTIVVAATTSAEGSDRQSLHLDNEADNVIAALTKKAKKLVVIAQIPGSVVMPWRDSVDAIAVMFLGGQQTGNAWGAVLFGDQSPSGHLPVTIPVAETDTISPSSTLEINYTEGMATSYRNKALTAAYPFGHGLSFTTFAYGAPRVIYCDDNQEEICISLSIRNVGNRPASTVPQLYLEFPDVAGHPAPLLKGFRKTDIIRAGGESNVTFKLTVQDMSYYGAGAWMRAPVHALTAHVGASSKDIRQSIRLTPSRKTDDIVI